MATTSKSIHESLANIQAELNVPKTHYNKFGGYNFRNTSDILDAVKPLAKKEGCDVVICDDILMVGERVYIQATASLTNTKGECVSSRAFAREEESKKGMDAAQVTGAASSYARKYALNGLFAIDDTADADELNKSKEYTEKPKSTTATTSKKSTPKTEEELVKAAKEAAKKVTNRAEFAQWWATYPALQGKEEFLALARELGNKFPRK